MTLAYTGVRSR